MSRKSKIDPALKVELVERYLEGEISAKEAGRLAGLAGNGADTFHRWVNIYRNEGPEGLLAQSHNRHYSEETKLQAVYDYLDGKGSQMVIAARYGLRSKRQLQMWLKREKYYGRRFTSRKDLVSAIEDYISYYNTERIQRNLHLMTPVEYHQQYYLAA